MNKDGLKRRIKRASKILRNHSKELTKKNPHEYELRLRKEVRHAKIRKACCSKQLANLKELKK